VVICAGYDIGPWPTREGFAMLTLSTWKGVPMPVANSTTVLPSESVSANGKRAYVLPLVHTHLPPTAVEVGFWGGLALAAALGAVDPAMALLVGAGVVIARHRRG
jgi:hypothetical protein